MTARLHEPPSTCRTYAHKHDTCSQAVRHTLEGLMMQRWRLAVQRCLCAPLPMLCTCFSFDGHVINSFGFGLLVISVVDYCDRLVAGRDREIVRQLTAGFCLLWRTWSCSPIMHRQRWARKRSSLCRCLRIHRAKMVSSLHSCLSSEDDILALFACVLIQVLPALTRHFARDVCFVLITYLHEESFRSMHAHSLCHVTR